MKVALFVVRSEGNSTAPDYVKGVKTLGVYLA